MRIQVLQKCYKRQVDSDILPLIELRDFCGSDYSAPPRFSVNPTGAISLKLYKINKLKLDQQSTNQAVGGSNPSGRAIFTIKINKLTADFLLSLRPQNTIAGVLRPRISQINILLSRCSPNQG